MYTRNLVILANSVKYSGHCIAGKDLDTGEWVRLINNEPRPFSSTDLQKMYGHPAGPSLLDCVKIPFLEKVPVYYQPENELISGDPWIKIGEFLKEKMSLLEDPQSPCWFGNNDYGHPNNIPASICNNEMPLPVSLYFRKLSPSENDLTLAYKSHENGNKPRFIFYFNYIRYELGLTDINFPRLGNDDDLQPKSYPESFVTLGVGQLFESMNAHYKLVVGVINSVPGIQKNTGENLGTSSSTLPPVPEQNQMEKTSLPSNPAITNYDQKLFYKLKTVRQSIANQDHVPLFVVFSNQCLKEMAHYRPCDLQNFKNIVGVGEYKLKKYGPAFTSAINEFCEEYCLEKNQFVNKQNAESDNVLEKIYALNQEISNLNDHVKELTNSKNILLDQVISSGIKQQGNYLLMSSSSSVRQLNLEAFKQLYPQVFLEIATVKLSDADKKLGTAEVTDLCTLKESIKYSVRRINSDTGIAEKLDE